MDDILKFANAHEARRRAHQTNSLFGDRITDGNPEIETGYAGDERRKTHMGKRADRILSSPTIR